MGTAGVVRGEAAERPARRQGQGLAQPRHLWRKGWVVPDGGKGGERSSHFLMSTSGEGKGD